MDLNTSKIQTVFFDLDGTLIDNFSAIYKCYADVATEMGLVPKSYKQLRATVGGSIVMTLSRLIGEDLAEEGVRRFRKHFPEVMFEDVFVLEGVEWILKNLRARGIRTAVFTNKERSASVALLDHLKLSPLIDAVFGTDMPDMPWRKPQAEYSRYVLEKLNLQAENAMLIGDSPFDISAARVVNMPVACVATGTHMPEALIEASGDQSVIFPNMYFLGKDLFGFNPEECP